MRLRPILMTSIATIAGALPPALAIGPGAELQRPMALALVGGMLVSTALTLFVVPAAYSLLDDVVNWNDERRQPQARAAWPPWPTAGRASARRTAGCRSSTRQPAGRRFGAAAAA